MYILPLPRKTIKCRTVGGSPKRAGIARDGRFTYLGMGDTEKAANVTLIPYYAWDNRGERSMVVWMPRNEELARTSMISNLQKRKQGR